MVLIVLVVLVILAMGADDSLNYNRHHRRSLVPSSTSFARLAVSLTLALSAGFVLRANVDARQARGQGPAPAPTPDPVPTAVNSIVANPSQYIGRPVSVTVSVATLLTATAFTIDQNHNIAQGEILVIAPTLVKVPAADAYVTVIGDLVAFDPADIATRFATYKLELSPEVIAKFRGKPAIIATAIVSSSFTDLMKRPPAPMTPDDQKLSAIMQQVSPASAALRAAAGASDAATVKARTAELRKLFGDANDVFKSRNILTAMLMLADAQTQIDAIDAAAAAAKWPDVTAATTTLTQACTTCHNAHRERQDDGTFRLKK